MHDEIPAAEADQLVGQYERLSDEGRWEYGERAVWRDIRRLLDGCPGRSVLDVGCFRGDFLAWLGDGWRRFGLEPSAAARATAEGCGISVLGDRIESLVEDYEFGAITLVDVIEHLARPFEALQNLVKFLVPGGKLIIFTGSTDSLSWRLAGRHYWYSSLPEHVAFFEPSWFRWAAPRLGCKFRLVARLPHGPKGIGCRIDEGAKNLIYLGYRRIEHIPYLKAIVSGLPLFRRVAHWDIPWWTSARDHILIALARVEPVTLRFVS